MAADKTLTVAGKVVFAGLGSSRVNEPLALSVPYQALIEGEVDVPDASAALASFAVPTGPVALATALFIQNNLDQAVKLVSQGDADSAFDLEPGGYFFFASPTAPGADEVADFAVALTETQVGAGTITFVVFGDPTGE